MGRGKAVEVIMFFLSVFVCLSGSVDRITENVVADEF